MKHTEYAQIFINAKSENDINLKEVDHDMPLDEFIKFMGGVIYALRDDAKTTEFKIKVVEVALVVEAKSHKRFPDDIESTCLRMLLFLMENICESAKQQQDKKGGSRTELIEKSRVLIRKIRMRLK